MYRACKIKHTDRISEKTTKQTRLSWKEVAGKRHFKEEPAPPLLNYLSIPRTAQSGRGILCELVSMVHKNIAFSEIHRGKHAD